MLFAIFMLASASCWAEAEVYIRPAIFSSYETNVFSLPEPEMKDGGKFKRAGLGAYLDVDAFLSPEGRTGLSLSFMYSHPLWTGSKMDGNADSSWVMSTDPTLSFAIGALFRAQLGVVDFGLALRASFASTELFNESLLLGLQVEPYIMLPIGSGDVLLSMGFVYDAHLYDFLLHDDEHYYRSDYFMLTFGGYAGVAVKL